MMKKSHNKRLLFIYDELMTIDEQQKVNIDLKFICFGMINAKMKFVTTKIDKRKSHRKKIERLFAVPSNGLDNLYGGIFLSSNYDKDKLKLHGYYHSSTELIGYSLSSDLYIPIESAVTPIKFDTITDLQICKFNTGNDVLCTYFIGNQNNERIKYNTKSQYYKKPPIKMKSFIQTVNEQRRLKKWDGMM